MSELLDTIGHNVRHLREEKGWNQTELGFHADTSPSIISLIENGKRNPSTATLAKIAGALGVEVADLFPKAPAPLSLENEEQRRLHYLRVWKAHINFVADRWQGELDHHNQISSITLQLDPSGPSVESKRPLPDGWASEVSSMSFDLTMAVAEVLEEEAHRFTLRERTEALEMVEASRRLGEVADAISDQARQEFLDQFEERYGGHIEEPDPGELERARERRAQRDQILDTVEAALVA